MAKMGDYEDSTVWQNVKDIIKHSKGTRLYDFKGTIYTPNESVGVWELNDIEFIRDYVNDVSYAIKIRFRIGLGDYVNRIYPHRDNLEFRLERFPIKEGGTQRKTTEPPIIRRFKVIFDPSINPPVGVSDLQMNKIQDLNKVDMPQLCFELVDRNMEPLRIKFTSGIYRNKKLIDFIRATLGGESLRIKVDGKPVIDALDIVEPDNKEEIPHIVIPAATHLSSITTLIQEKIGIYNKGLGTFFQTYRDKRTWFVYPLYDDERFDKVEYKAVFYTVPQDKLPQLDRSYWEDGKVLKVAVTAQRMYKDSAELTMMNSGSGFRMPDANAYMKKPIKITADGPVAKRANLNHEVTTKEREDGLNYAPMTVNGPSANPFVKKSYVLAHSFAQIDILWENADDELIYPGMPCKYVYLSQGQAIELKGEVLFCHVFTAHVEKQHAQAFKTMMRLSIACAAQFKIPELDYYGVPGEEDEAT